MQITFSDPADVVAPKLLGGIFRHNGVAVRLTEVEAYLGENDAASHTARGKTARNAAMFGPPGHLYVYLSYGIHLAGNLVCAPEGVGQGCLMRAGEIVEGIEIARARRGDVPDWRLASGPGNLGKALGLDLSDNGTPVDFEPVEQVDYVTGPRIGISKNAAAPLRFWIPREKTVSRSRKR